MVSTASRFLGVERSVWVRVNVYLQAGFYLFAGANHFVHPEFYAPLMPPYLPAHDVLNALAGVAELSLGAALLHPRSRPWAVWGIILLLLALVPAHLHMIAMKGCLGALCVGPLAAHLRLWVGQPLLMLWAWSARR